MSLASWHLFLPSQGLLLATVYFAKDKILLISYFFKNFEAKTILVHANTFGQTVDT